MLSYEIRFSVKNEIFNVSVLYIGRLACMLCGPKKYLDLSNMGSKGSERVISKREFFRLHLKLNKKLV